MTTNRTPINRPPITRITPKAVNLFRRMQEVKDGSDEWWELHAKLHDELQLKPWEWPAIEHPNAESDLPDSAAGAQWFPLAQQLYRELKFHAAT
jgi:hypothetical protein